MNKEELSPHGCFLPPPVTKALPVTSILFCWGQEMVTDCSKDQEIVAKKGEQGSVTT